MNKNTHRVIGIAGIITIGSKAVLKKKIHTFYISI